VSASVRKLAGLAFLVAMAFGPAMSIALTDKTSTTMSNEETLSGKQRTIPPIAAATATGDMPRLNTALNAGLDAGLTVSDAKEILVQLYAYTGFPRSLNALGELMKVLDARKQRGVNDTPGSEPRPVPTGAELKALGTANQTKLSGAPVKGPLFDFAPAIDEYLKTHLFGDIFARDNVDWQTREIATVGALAALPGVESQLRSHIRISMNVGLTATQLRIASDALAQAGQLEAAARLRAELGADPASGQVMGSTAEQQIARADTQAASEGAPENFTGRVHVQPVWPAEGGINASGGMVTFEPGARSAWHTHPLGQRLMVISGIGLTQEWGKPVQVIHAGDVVSCPPGVKHWHGATATTAMTHLAVTGALDGKNVTWLEHVSDEQYRQGTP
jgi:quercetin dioxygenase-like cupin family protein/alkylhydroperoxidase/carboxymuconolactone decarboxylase family protein YurZ